MGTEFIRQLLSESQEVCLARLMKACTGIGGTMAWALQELQLHQHGGLALPDRRKRGDSCLDTSAQVTTHHTQHAFGHTAWVKVLSPCSFASFRVVVTADPLKEVGACCFGTFALL